MIKLSLVIPCYNEEKNIPLIVERFKRALNKKDNNYDIKTKKENIDKKSIELILVDNGSIDRTKEAIQKLSKKYKYIKLCVVKKNIGYGNGIYQGFNMAKGEFLCWTHGDVQTNPKDAIKAYEIISRQKEPKKCFVKGKRYGRSFFDVFFTVGMSIFETLLFGKKFWDINAQPNMFYRDLFKKFKEPPLDFSFDLYVYYLAQKNNFKIIRFPVDFRKRIHGESHWNTSIKGKWKFIKRTIDFSFKLKKNVN